jgi:hypothetical protein
MSVLDVCNEALLLIGEPPIFSLDEGTTQAKRLNIVFDRSFTHLLSSHHFSFALVTSSLVQTSGVTPFVGYSYVFAKPTGLLFLKDVVNLNNKQIPFRLSKDGIHTQEAGELYAEYTVMVDIDDTSPLFRTALAYYMATKMHNDVSDNASKYQVLRDDFELHWKKCVGRDGVHAHVRVIDNTIEAMYR